MIAKSDTNHHRAAHALASLYGRQRTPASRSSSAGRIGGRVVLSAQLYRRRRKPCLLGKSRLLGERSNDRQEQMGGWGIASQNGIGSHHAWVCVFEVALLLVNHTSSKRKRGTQVKAFHMVAFSDRVPRWRFGLVFALANSRENTLAQLQKVSAGPPGSDEGGCPLPARR